MSPIELHKSFPKWSWSSLCHLQFSRYRVVSFSCQIFQMRITADISKISKTVQRDLTIIFNDLSESVVIFVPNLILLALENVVNFTQKEFSQKRGCVTMRNYVETFCLYTAYKVAPNVLTQISSCKNYVFVAPTSRVNSAKTRFSPSQFSLRKCHIMSLYQYKDIVKRPTKLKSL